MVSLPGILGNHNTAWTMVLYCECQFSVWHLPEGKLIHNNFTAWHSTINIANCDFFFSYAAHQNPWSKLNGLNFSLRRHRSTFHRFLKMLACFDGLVVTCIFLMYALPVMCTTYKKVKHFFLHTWSATMSKILVKPSTYVGCNLPPGPFMDRVNLSNKNSEPCNNRAHVLGGI